MINKEYFDKIHDFCKNRTTSPVDEKILLHMFYTEYFELLEKQKALKGKISEQEMSGYEISLLSETNLIKNMKIAESEREDLINKEVEKGKIKYKILDVLFTIFLNIVSSFIFIILSMLLLAAMRNQLRPILRDIFVEPIIIIDKPQE